MPLNRRTFIAASTAAGAVTLAAGTSTAITLPNPPTGLLKLSCQESIAPGKTLAEKLDFMEKNGFVGIEPGGKGLGDRITEFQTALKGRAITLSAICAGFDGVLISEDETVRRRAVASMKEILTAAGALGSTGLIIVPAFNNQTKLSNAEARPLLIDLLKELGEHAVSVKTRILLEPLNRKEAFFLRLVADAAAICRDVDSPGIACMGDFWHMTWEETSDLGAIISGGNHLHHMHIASRKQRRMPGEDEGDNYVEGFRGMKAIGFTDFLSFECGSTGDKMTTIPAAIRLIRDQWKSA